MRTLLTLLVGLMILADTNAQTEDIDKLYAEFETLRVPWEDLLSKMQQQELGDWEFAQLSEVNYELSKAADYVYWMADLLALEADDDTIADRCKLFVGSIGVTEWNLTSVLLEFEDSAEATSARDGVEAWRSAMDLMEKVCRKHGWEPED